MNFFAILVIVGFLIWAVLLLDTLVSARVDTNEVATKCLVRQVHLGEHTGVSSIQGHRSHMEDTYQVSTNLPNDDQSAIFSVFDGHGGARASEFCAENLHNLIESYLIRPQASTSQNMDIIPLRALQSAFRQLDRVWLERARIHNWEDGSTAVCALVYKGVLYVANVGDSRAVLCTSAPPISTTTSANGTPGTLTPLRLYAHGNHSHSGSNSPFYHSHQPHSSAHPNAGISVGPVHFSMEPTHSSLVRSIEMSSDHKPTREDERKRIESLGGRIIFHGTWRVEGILALTRAIGDKRLKAFVSGEPEVRRRRLIPGDSVLVIASDGLWDVVSSAEVCNIIRGATSSQEAADTLTRAAFSRGSADNITTMVINLRPYVGSPSNTTVHVGGQNMNSNTVPVPVPVGYSTSASFNNTVSPNNVNMGKQNISSTPIPTGVSENFNAAEGNTNNADANANANVSNVNVGNGMENSNFPQPESDVERSKKSFSSTIADNKNVAEKHRDATMSTEDTPETGSELSANDNDNLRNRNRLIKS